MGQGFVVWLTGLPSSGKSTIAKSLEDSLKSHSLKVEILDGDDFRNNISSDLGFSVKDREVQTRRVIYVSKLLQRNEIIVIVALVSPLKQARDEARQVLKNFVEVWVNCPLDVCIQRDVKGLYREALSGKISNMTGIHQEFEEPLNPEVIVYTEKEDVGQSVSKIIKKVQELGLKLDVN